MAHDAAAPLEPSVTDGFAQVLDLRVGGTLVARYHYGGHLPRPYLAPLTTPDGRAVTADPGPADHPHHRGVWAGHRDAGGVDHWTDFAGHGRIVHERFEAVGPTIRERLAWLDRDGRAALREERLIRLHPGPGVTLDWTVRLTAAGGPLVLGREKDAAMVAVRVAPTIDAIENAAGGRGESACWGRRAAWCDMSGPLGGAIAGVAVLDHPGNPRHPAPWHVRAYGLLAPNPFLEAPLALGAGESVAFRHRLVVHDGDAGAARIADRHRDFSQED